MTMALQNGAGWRTYVEGGLDALADSESDVERVLEFTEGAKNCAIPRGVKDYVQRAESAIKSKRETNVRAARYLEAALREGDAL